MNEITWKLLDIDPPRHGEVARLVVQVLLVAETEWRKYDMMRVFANEAEARSYALAHQIPLIME